MKFSIILRLMIVAIVVMMTINSSEALSCRFGRGACVASCQAQNCATGYCPNGANGICVCSRCGQGPPW